MWKDLLFSLWFLLPAAIANVTPILASAVPGLRDWNAPMDGGKTYRGKQLLGPHKTWRGLISGVVMASFIFWLQHQAVTHTGWAQELVTGTDYELLPVFIIGPLFGIGALGGDAIESFFKRRHGVPSGKSWIPFDQTDYVIGGLLATLPFIVLSIRVYITILVTWTAIHFLASYAGWLLGLKKAPI